jgi:hypothetical protein
MDTTLAIVFWYMSTWSYLFSERFKDCELRVVVSYQKKATTFKSNHRTKKFHVTLLLCVDDVCQTCFSNSTGYAEFEKQFFEKSKFKTARLFADNAFNELLHFHGMSNETLYKFDTIYLATLRDAIFQQLTSQAWDNFKKLPQDMCNFLK